jgi:HAE1 family hydrophobic/amphiphilic exporter-1
LGRLPLEQLPTISSSGITVNVSYQSSSPEEVERLIVLPLEEALGTLNNIDRIGANASRNGASVRVDFKAGTDMDLANMEMRERVDQARANLPGDVDRIQLRRWQSDQRPIVDASMAWRGQDNRLAEIFQKVIEPRLLRLKGVANVTVDDMEEKQLIVEVDQERLQAHDVSLQTLAWQVRSNNVNVSLGRVMDGNSRFLVRALGEFQKPEEIGQLFLPGRQLRLEDVGQVVYDYPEKKRYERLNGVDAVEVEVHKASAANVVEVGLAAAAELERIRQEYGGKLDLKIVRNRAEDVLRELGNLTNSAFLGAFLAIGIIFVFLRNIRSTLAVGVAIPTAALCVFTGMYVARELFDSTITLNMVSMMGLMLAVGMLVDPAVVTLESIFRRRQEENEEPYQAAQRGSREVGMAVLASGLTTICVFIPFFFLSDSRSATWMRDAGLTICIAIVVSMIVALSLVPLASSRLFKKEYERFDGWITALVGLALAGLAGWQLKRAGAKAIRAWYDHWSRLVWESVKGMEWTTWAGLGATALGLAFLGWYCRRHGLRSSYGQLLDWTLDHRLFTLAVTVVLLGAGIYLFTRIEQRGTPWTPERRVDITVEIDRSYTLEEVKALFTEIEELILSRKEELDIEALATDFRQRRGSISAHLVPADDGKLSTMQASNAIKKLLPEKVGINYKMGRSRSWAGPELGVEVQLRGRNPDVLAVLVEEVKAQLARLPGVQDVDSSLEDGEEEIRVNVDREQALGYGLSPQQVAANIAQALGTRRTSSFKAKDREIDIVLQLEEEDRKDLEQLKNSRFEGRDGTPIQLAALADFRLQKGPQDLNREDRELNVTVFANTADRNQAAALTPQIEAMMKGMALPPGYSWDLGRAARWMQEDASDNHFTMLFAVLLIYLIMASLFESLIHPFTIMLAIPFSLIGVALGLFALDVPLDNNGALGVLILFGIVVNNGIVLVDHINHYRREGMTRRQAIIRGGQNRLRPIMMTASTTILNLMPLVLPMVYGTLEGFARRWGPVGLVVVCGLASSTVLTLLLAPMLYSLLDDVGLWIKRVARAARG